MPRKPSEEMTERNIVVVPRFFKFPSSRFYAFPSSLSFTFVSFPLVSVVVVLGELDCGCPFIFFFILWFSILILLFLTRGDVLFGDYSSHTKILVSFMATEI